MTQRWIVHVDVDAMYCSVARLVWPERLRDVELLVVGGHPEKRGVVASASHPARRLGIHSGMPMRTAVGISPDIVAAPVPWRAVRRASRKLFEVLARFGERVERASIDEGYLLLPAEAADPEPVAHEIRAAVMAETGLAVSLGVSTLRFTAKMATSRAKPTKGGTGVYVVPAGGEYDFVAAHEPGDIPFVGPALVETLKKRGVNSIESLRRIDLATLKLWLGPARARFLHDRVRAIDATGVSAEEEQRKSISSEQTFERDLRDFASLERELASLAADAGETLRRENLFARTVGVKVRDSTFKDRQRHRTLPQFVTSDEAILRVATELLRELRDGQSSWIRLLGVTLSGLEGPGAVEQLTLDPVLPPLETETERAHARRADG